MMSRLQSRVEKLEGVNPASRYTVIEHHIYEPSLSGARFTGDVLRTDIAGRSSRWIKVGTA